MKYVLLLCCLLPLTSVAESYRWTDEDGNVHFSDQPPPDRDGEQTEEIELTNPEPIGQGESVERTRRELEEMRRERQKRESKAQQKEKRRELQRLQKCQRESRKLATMKNKRVLYKQEDGSYSGVSMDEHQRRIREREKWLRENCEDG